MVVLNRESKRLALIAVGGIVLRAVLFALGMHEILRDRVELTTPVSSLSRAIEARSLLRFHLSPYEGDAFSAHPLLFWILYPLLSISIGDSTIFSTFMTGLTFISMDLIILFALTIVALRYYSSLPKKFSKGKAPALWILFLVYMFNPFTVLTCLSGSLVIFKTLFLVLSLVFAVWDLMIPSALFVAAAASVSITSVFAVVPLVLVLVEGNKRKEKTKQNSSSSIFRIALFLVCFVSIFIAIQHICRWSLGGDVNWMKRVFYSYPILALDLTPNVGLFWYLLTESFGVYRMFFVLVLHFIPLSTILPLCVRMNDQPIILFFIVSGIVNCYCAYPSLGDSVLHLTAIFGVFPHLLAYFRNSIVFVVLAVCSVFFPLFWQTWIVDGTGNANFFYGATLGFSIATTFTLVDSVHSSLLVRWLDKHENDKND